MKGKFFPRHIIPEIKKLYEEEGKSANDISLAFNVHRDAVRYHLIKSGVKMRSSHEALKLSDKSKFGAWRIGKKFPMKDEQKKKISIAKMGKGKGTSIKPNGYVEFTMGEHKGRSEHVVTMEKIIGISLKGKGIVHHIDGDRQNNNSNNLAFMTLSAHSRLHREQEKNEDKIRTRDRSGKYSKEGESNA